MWRLFQRWLYRRMTVKKMVALGISRKEANEFVDFILDYSVSVKVRDHIADTLVQTRLNGIPVKNINETLGIPPVEPDVFGDREGGNGKL